MTQIEDTALCPVHFFLYQERRVPSTELPVPATEAPWDWGLFPKYWLTIIHRKMFNTILSVVYFSSSNRMTVHTEWLAVTSFFKTKRYTKNLLSYLNCSGKETIFNAFCTLYHVDIWCKECSLWSILSHTFGCYTLFSEVLPSFMFII